MKQSDWHQRFIQQAVWSRSARSYFLSQITVPPHARLLELGSGTGAVLSEWNTSWNRYGIDIDFSSLGYAKSINNYLHLANADGYQLPFQDNSFDLTFCHYLLLWLTNPEEMVLEMLRVTRPGGWVCCFAEPDYAARLDSPPPLDQFGFAQNLALADQGIQLQTGRNLTTWLTQAGLTSIQSGILGGHWHAAFDPQSWQLEWLTLYHDLAHQLDASTLAEYQNIDRQAYQQGNRVLFIPTFYAWGKKENY